MKKTMLGVVIVLIILSPLGFYLNEERTIEQQKVEHQRIYSDLRSNLDESQRKGRKLQKQLDCAKHNRADCPR